MGKLLSKKDIFAKKALDPRTANVPQWGGDVRYKPMTMVERREIRKKSSSTTEVNGVTTVEIDQEMMEVMAVVTCVLDPVDENSLMFNQDDVHILLGEMSAGAITTISTAILAASGLASNSFRESEEESEE